MDAGERLDERFGLTLYRVPPKADEEFLAWAGRAADVYRRHALSWSLWRHRENPEELVELGPEFRERAALERAAAELDGAGTLERLAKFETSLPGSDGGGFVEFLFSSHDYDAMFNVGGTRAPFFDEPPA